MTLSSAGLINRKQVLNQSPVVANHCIDTVGGQFVYEF